MRMLMNRGYVPEAEYDALPRCVLPCARTGATTQVPTKRMSEVNFTQKGAGP